MRKLLVPVLLILFPFVTRAQQFGGNPPSLDWKQINSDTVRVIFPAGMDSQANRAASIIHYLAARKPMSLGEQLRKINVVLQNQTIVPNGYVQLGPFRSEFFMTPPPNNFDQGSLPWVDQLALHEYRHVQQFNNFNNGISRVMKFIFGEEGYAVAINASVPDWFYEGDAVASETVQTGQGRGRLPSFLNTYPSIWQAGKKYSWMKLRNGSFKDYVPNHYDLGYLLVNYGNEKYGPGFWQKVTADASAYKGLFYPLQKAIRTHAGISYVQFREDAFDFYKKKTERTAISRDEFLFPVKKDHVRSFYFPYQAATGQLFFLESSFRKRPAFYTHEGGNTKRLRARDISTDEQFSYRNGKIVYAAFESDPRWAWRTYSVIKILDVETGRQRSLTRKSRYFSPDISESGSKVAAVYQPENGKSELHILDGKTGSILNRVSPAGVNMITDPKFINEQTLVSALRLNNGEMTLAKIDLGTNAITRLLPESFHVLGYPSVNGDMIYFTASFGGNDDVFRVRLGEKEVYRVTDGPLGNYYVNAANGKVTWSAFTAEGLQLKQVDEKDIRAVPVNITTIENVTETFPVSKTDLPENTLENNIPFREFEVSTYKKSTRLVNFHSWRPYFEDPVFTYSLYGQNVLNTLQTEVFYSYNRNEKTNSVGFNAVYGAWFPLVDVGTEYTFDREGITADRPHRWAQLDTRAGFVVPLNFVSGRTFKNLSISNYYVLRNQFNKGFFKDSIGNVSYSYLTHTINWSQQVQRAVQHIFPRWGYALAASHRYPVSRYDGYQFYGAASLFLPGIGQSHHLVLTGAFQQRDTARLIFSSRLANARGYTDYYVTRAGSRLWRLSGNYHLPLLYPDWGFGNILYFQRLRANVFYDLQRLFSDSKSITYDLKSAGVEFYLDTKWWNQYPLTFGFRISRLLEDEPHIGGRPAGTYRYDFILPVSIIPR